MSQRLSARPGSEKRLSDIGQSSDHRGDVPFTEKGDYADEVHRNDEAFDLGFDLPREDPARISGRLLVGPNVRPDTALPSDVLVAMLGGRVTETLNRNRKAREWFAWAAGFILIGIAVSLYF
jgi:hypothetical protein